MTNEGLVPGISFAMAKPTDKKMANIIKNHAASTFGVFERSPNITPICAEHGMHRARRSVAIKRSLLVGSVRVTIVAIVSQPSPKTMGIIALPESPIFLNARSSIKASLGKYPESSIKANTRKNNPTIGKIITAAYFIPSVTMP